MGFLSVSKKCASGFWGAAGRLRGLFADSELETVCLRGSGLFQNAAEKQRGRKIIAASASRSLNGFPGRFVVPEAFVWEKSADGGRKAPARDPESDTVTGAGASEPF
jgi:hypothetical protein